MPRKRKQAAEGPQANTSATSQQPATGPHIIHPNAVYRIEDAIVALRLCQETLQREHRLGRLRIAFRAGKRWILGSWLLSWFETGELRRPELQDQRQPAPEQQHPPGQTLPPTDGRSVIVP